MSPRGKAKDFDSFIRGFESRHPSQMSCGFDPIFIYVYDPVAQPAEHLPFKQGVRSSNLRWVTKRKHHDTRRGVSFWPGGPEGVKPFSFPLLGRSESARAKVLLRKTLVTLDSQRAKILEVVAAQRFHGFSFFFHFPDIAHSTVILGVF